MPKCYKCDLQSCTEDSNKCLIHCEKDADCELHNRKPYDGPKQCACSLQTQSDWCAFDERIQQSQPIELFCDLIVEVLDKDGKKWNVMIIDINVVRSWPWMNSGCVLLCTFVSVFCLDLQEWNVVWFCWLQQELLLSLSFFCSICSLHRSWLLPTIHFQMNTRLFPQQFLPCATFSIWSFSLLDVTTISWLGIDVCFDGNTFIWRS